MTEASGGVRVALRSSFGCVCTARSVNNLASTLSGPGHAMLVMQPVRREEWSEIKLVALKRNLLLPGTDPLDPQSGVKGRFCSKWVCCTTEGRPPFTFTFSSDWDNILSLRISIG